MDCQCQNFQALESKQNKNIHQTVAVRSTKINLNKINNQLVYFSHPKISFNKGKIIGFKHQNIANIKGANLNQAKIFLNKWNGHPIPKSMVNTTRDASFEWKTYTHQDSYKLSNDNTASNNLDKDIICKGREKSSSDRMVVG